MNETINQCQWPSLPERYDKALRQATQFILDNFAAKGIITSGSVIRGNPDPTSDLDIYVIQLEPFRQRIQRWLNGVPVELFINPPATIERYFHNEQAARRPITAHMLATGFVVLGLDPIVAELRAKAAALLAAPPPSPDDVTMSRYLIATLYEDALDMAERDPHTAQMLLSRAVWDMLHHCFVQDGRFIPRHKELLNQLATFDSLTAELACGYFTEPSLVAKFALAGEMADRVIGTRGFFEWETTPETQPGE